MANKRDLGFIPELGITEAKRDELKKRDWTGRVKNITPTDNWTTADCVEKKFSGLRINRINGTTELWAVGKLLIARNTQQIGRNPNLLATMHEEAYGTLGSILEIDVNIRRVKRRGPR